MHIVPDNVREVILLITMWGLISPKTSPFLAHLEAQGGSHSSCFYTSQEAQAAQWNGETTHTTAWKRDKLPQTHSAPWDVVTLSERSNSNIAPLPPLTPHPRNCLKPTALPLSPWKKRKHSKRQNKKHQPNQKASCPF